MPSYMIHVDKAVNTVSRDDSKGGSTLQSLQQSLRNQYQTEAQNHPGVALVAQKIE